MENRVRGRLRRGRAALAGALAAVAVAATIGAPSAIGGRAEAAPGSHYVRGTVRDQGQTGADEWTVSPLNRTGSVVASVTTTTGAYALAAHDGGPFTLEVESSGFTSYATTWWDGDTGTYFRADAAPITIAGADVAIPVIELARVTEVTGKVAAYDDEVGGLEVTAYPAAASTYSADHSLAVDTLDDGSYDLLLPAGSWKLRYGTSGALWYHESGVELAPWWHGGSGTFREAVAITEPGRPFLSTVTMTAGGSVGGTVTDADTGLPLRDVDVTVTDGDGMPAGHAIADNDGTYTVGLLGRGEVTVEAEDLLAGDYLPQAGGRPVLVRNQPAGPVDLVMTRAVVPPDPSAVDLQGTVTDQAGVPERGVRVAAYASCSDEWDGTGPVEVGVTDLVGAYALTRLDPASTGTSVTDYHLRFDDAYGVDDDLSLDHDDSFQLRTGWYADTRDCETSPAIGVGSRADQALLRYGGLSGTDLTEAGEPTSGFVEIYRAQDVHTDEQFGNARWTSAGTELDGTWTAGALEPGTYLVRFVDVYHDFVWTWWQDALHWQDATPVTVEPGVMTSGLAGHMWNLVRAVSPPVVSGVPAVGSVLTSTTGYWVGHDLQYSLTWYRVVSGDDLVVGTGPTYQVRPEDAGGEIYVLVTASGAGGSRAAVSSWIQIQPDPPDATPTPTPTPTPTAAPTTAPTPTTATPTETVRPHLQAEARREHHGRRVRLRILVTTQHYTPQPVTGGTVRVLVDGRVVERGAPVVNGLAVVTFRRPPPGVRGARMYYSGTTGVAEARMPVRFPWVP